MRLHLRSAFLSVLKVIGIYFFFCFNFFTVAVLFIYFASDMIGIHLVTKVPYNIKEPGYYRVVNNLSTQSEGINIFTDNVVLDLGGFKLDGETENVASSYDGVFANHRRNITVRNGTITGFKNGINIYDEDIDNLSDVEKLTSSGHLIENIRAVRNQRVGIMIVARSSSVRDNLVSGVLGNVSAQDLLYSYGISAQGPGLIIENNQVVNIVPPKNGEGVGITIGRAGTGCIVKNNLVTNTSERKAGKSYGIWIGGEKTQAYLDSNTVVNQTIGVAFSSTSRGTFNNNVVMQSDQSYLLSNDEVKSGGNNLGGNAEKE